MTRDRFTGPFKNKLAAPALPLAREGEVIAGAPAEPDGARTRVSLFRRDAQGGALVQHAPARGEDQLRRDPLVFAPLNPRRVWESLTDTASARDTLARAGLFSDSTTQSACSHFDMLRTRVLQAMARKGWRRLVVTSPTAGCGKSFVAANLALSLSRLPNCATVLLDLDLRAPRLADLFAQTDIGLLSEFLSGEQPLEGHFRRHGERLALGLSGAALPFPAETLQAPEFVDALDHIDEMLVPDMVICDTPPALAVDDVISLAGSVDAVLLVTDGTKTRAEDIRACERLLEDRIPLLGIVLNRGQDAAAHPHAS